MKTIPTEEAKDMHDHAIEFERKLISIWLQFVLPPEECRAIETGAYKARLAQNRNLHLKAE